MWKYWTLSPEKIVSAVSRLLVRAVATRLPITRSIHQSYVILRWVHRLTAFSIPASNLPFAWAPAFPGVKLKVFSACGGCMCPSLQWPGPTIRSETEHFPLCSSDIQISNSGHFQVRGSPSASHCFASLLNQFSPSTSPPQKRCVLSPLSTHTQPPTAQLLLPSPKTFPPIRLLLLLIHSSPFSICNSTTLPYLYPRSRPLLCPRATHSSSIYS